MLCGEVNGDNKNGTTCRLLGDVSVASPRNCMTTKGILQPDSLYITALLTLWCSRVHRTLDAAAPQDSKHMLPSNNVRLSGRVSGTCRSSTFCN